MSRATTVTWSLVALLAAAGALALGRGIPLMALLAFTTAPLFAWSLLTPRLARNGRPPARLVGILTAATLAHVSFHATGIYGRGEWDTLLHFVTPFAFGLLVLVLVEQFAVPAGHVGPSRLALGLATFFVTAFLATGWELYEFLFDTIAHTRSQDDLMDTMLDLLAGVAAGALAGGMGPRLLRRSSLRPLQQEVAALREANETSRS